MTTQNIPMTMATTDATDRLSVGLPQARSRSGSSSGAAPLKDNHWQLLQLVLFWAGAILLPLGLVVIVLGWYGAANTPYQYDQLSYLVSGGLLGLGLTFTGGFLYFGAWLARRRGMRAEHPRTRYTSIGEWGVFWLHWPIRSGSPRTR